MSKRRRRDSMRDVGQAKFAKGDFAFRSVSGFPSTVGQRESQPQHDTMIGYTDASARNGAETFTARRIRRSVFAGNAVDPERLWKSRVTWKGEAEKTRLAARSFHHPGSSISSKRKVVRFDRSSGPTAPAYRLMIALAGIVPSATASRSRRECDQEPPNLPLDEHANALEPPTKDAPSGTLQ
jgi:hypothetical protein